MKKLTLIALSALMLMGACKKSDDIDKIFEGRTWYIVRGTIQGRPISGDNLKQFYQNDNAYQIRFGKESLQGTLSSGVSFSGTWKADGKKQTMELILLNLSGSASELDNAIFNTLRKTISYKGDENQIELRADDQNFIGFNSTRTKESNY